MKLPTLKPVIKLLVFMVVLALVIWGLTLFDDYRVSVFGMMALCVLAACMAFWALVRRPGNIAILMALLLGLETVRSQDQLPEKKQDQKEGVGPVIAGCAILVVGAIIIWGVWKLCKKIPGPPPKGKAPSSTNEPPQDTYMVGFSSTTPPLVMPDGYGITAYNDWDENHLKFQSSTNGVDWKDEYEAVLWVNNSQWVNVMYDGNGLPLKTNWGFMGWTNETIVSDFSRVLPRRDDAPLKLWRALQP
jgi:hypothetical protein